MGLKESTAAIREYTRKIVAECDAIDGAPTPPVPPDPPPNPPNPPTPGIDAVTGLSFALAPRSRCRVMTAPMIVKSNLTLTEDLLFPRDGLCIAKAGITLDLAGHTIYYADAGAGYGVRLFTSWVSDDQKRFGKIDGADQYANNVTIKNGAIVCVTPGLGDCHGISSVQADSLRVENCYIEAAGNDNSALGDTDGTFTINIQWGTQTAITNCTLVAKPSLPVDRHLLPANLRLGNGSSVTGSRLIGGNTGVKFVGTCKITRNLICHSAYVANGCGVIIGDGCNDSEVSENLILPVSGHGLFLAGNPQNNVIRDNIALACGIPHAEFQADGPPMGGLRIRDYPSGNTVSGNFLFALAGVTYERACALTCIQRKPRAGQQPNKITDNTLAAALRGSYMQVDPISGRTVPFYSRALNFEQPEWNQGVAIVDEITNNDLWGNDIVVGLSGFDGGANQRAPVTGNRLALKGGAEMAEAFSDRANRWLVDHQAGNPLAQQQVEAALDRVLTHAAGAPLTTDRRLIHSGTNGGEYIAWGSGNLAASDIRNSGASALRVIDGDGWRIEMQGTSVRKIVA